jgi:prepilin-type N-terminal cleavage/methylation domain-containing protein
MHFLKANGVPSKTPSQKLQAFTLIELLVVIAIIAILAGLLFPAAQSALNSAKKTTAKNQVVQIATAITAYETEYGCLPTNSSGQMDSATVLELTTNNPRSISFLDVSSWKQGKGGTNASGAFCDPWSNVYSVSLDTNYANSLQLPTQTSPGGTVTTNTLPKHIGVWTIWTNRAQYFLIDSWD